MSLSKRVSRVQVERGNTATQKLIEFLRGRIVQNRKPTQTEMRDSLDFLSSKHDGVSKHIDVLKEKMGELEERFDSSGITEKDGDTQCF